MFFAIFGAPIWLPVVSLVGGYRARSYAGTFLTIGVLSLLWVALIASLGSFLWAIMMDVRTIKGQYTLPEMLVDLAVIVAIVLFGLTGHALRGAKFF